MKYEILPSGAYRVRPRINGKRFSLTFDHEPTEKEITNAFNNKLYNEVTTSQKPQKGISFEQAVKDYIELKKDRNSPSTLREYEKVLKRFSAEFKAKDIYEIEQLDVDKEVANWLKKDLHYKTMLNYFRMAQTVIRKFGGKTYTMDMLPEKPKKEEPYIPTNEDVSKLLEYAKVNYKKMYVPIWLACYGLRRGEVCALDPDTDIDYENSIIHVTKDLVEDSDHNWVAKEPKTQASKRDVPVAKDLTELIRLSGWKYNEHPHTINKTLRKCEIALGIPTFSLHKLRHYCCSELFDMGCTETDVMAFMGWEKESDCMRQVYKHSRLKTDQERQRDIADKLTSKMNKKEAK